MPPVSGVDQFVWSMARGGYLGVSAATPTMLANSTVSSTVTSGYPLAAGTINLAGLGVVPMNTWAAVAVDITVAGTVTLVSAPANTTTGYTTSDLAFAALPAVGVGLFRVGQFAVSNSTGTFTFGTDSLQALNANFITQCASDTAHDSFSPYGPFTTIPRPCPVGNQAWYATPDDPTALHDTAPSANNPLLWDDGTTYKDFGQSFDGGQNQAYLVSIPLLSVAFAANSGHTVGDVWSFRWMDSRLASIVIAGAEISSDPTTIPRRDCFYCNMTGPTGPADLYNLFINHVNGFVLEGCRNLTGGFDQVANFSFTNNSTAYTEWGTCTNLTYTNNKTVEDGSTMGNISSLCAHFYGTLNNVLISGNSFADWGIEPNSYGPYYSRYSAIRFDSSPSYNNVVIEANTFRNERTDVLSNRVWFGIYGLAANYSGITIRDNDYSPHVVPIAGDSSFLSEISTSPTSQNYGYTFTGTYSLVNQDSLVHSRIDFSPPLVTPMRLVSGSQLVFSGSSNAANNITYTVAREVRDVNDAITAIIFSTAAPDPTTATFTGITCPAQAVLTNDDNIHVNLISTCTILVNAAAQAVDYRGTLRILNSGAPVNSTVILSGVVTTWTGGQLLSPGVGVEVQLSLSKSGASASLSCITNSRNSSLVSTLGASNQFGSTITYDVSQSTNAYTYGLLSGAINSNPAPTTLGYYNQVSYEAKAAISHSTCNLNQLLLNDTSGGLAHIDSVWMNNTLLTWSGSTIGTLIHYEAKSAISCTGIGTEYGFKVTNLTGITAKWAFYSDKSVIPSYHAGQYNFGGTVATPLGSLNADGTITVAGGTSGGVAFADALHKSVSSEISTITLKTTPALADLAVIESFADGYAKRAATLQSIVALATGGGARPFVQLTADNATVAQCNANSIFLCANTQTTFTIPYGVNVDSRISIIPLTATTIQGATGVSYQTPTGVVGTAPFVKANVNPIDMVCALTNTWLIEGQGAHKMEEHTNYGTSASIQKVAQLYWDALVVTGYAPVAITGAANNGSGLIRITSTAHGLATGNAAVINSVGGVTAANGAWIVTVIDANTYDLNGSTFSGTYTSGGTGTRAKQYGPGGAATTAYGDAAYYTTSTTGGSIQVLTAGDYRIAVAGEAFFLSNAGGWHYVCKNGVMLPGANRYLLNSAAAYGSFSFAIDRVVTLVVNDTLTMIADCETAGTTNYPGRVSFSLTKLS